MSLVEIKGLVKNSNNDMAPMSFYGRTEEEAMARYQAFVDGGFRSSAIPLEQGNEATTWAQEDALPQFTKAEILSAFTELLECAGLGLGESWIEPALSSDEEKDEARAYAVAGQYYEEAIIRLPDGKIDLSAYVACDWGEENSVEKYPALAKILASLPKRVGTGGSK